MKHLFVAFLLVLGMQSALIGQELAPYIKVAEIKGSVQSVAGQVTNALQQRGFEVLGTYQPARNAGLHVIAFTRDDLKNTAVKVADRGALGAVMKVGLVAADGRVMVSVTNPDYLLRAYLRGAYATHHTTLGKFTADLKSAMALVGPEAVPFGGAVEAEKLKDYHYKIMMPYFTDPVTLGQYTTFEEGLQTITANLKAKKGNTVQVYRLVYPDKQVAVFGVGLNSPEDGEAHFLPKIGEAHVAALPYEIILQGTEATMLHGKYRIALHWPDLTMGTFMKIMSTPGDIEDTLEGLCERADSGI